MGKSIIIILVLLVVVVYLALLPVDERAKELLFEESRWSSAQIAQLKTGPHYLSADLVIDIPPPNSPYSIETDEEIAYMRMLEERRTPAQEDLINSQIDDFRAYFLEQAGISPSTKPLTLLLMKEVMNETGFFILREKWRFQRARPYDVEPTLDISIALPPHASYPSGHAGQSWAAALLLSELDSKRRDLWLETARSIGHNREIAGVHFPSDTSVGQRLSDQVMSLLLENQEFKTKFAQTKELEWNIE